MSEKKFSFQEIVSDSPAVVQHDLQKEFNRKRRRGGDLEYLAIKKAELAAFETILKQLLEINQKLQRLEK